MSVVPATVVSQKFVVTPPIVSCMPDIVAVKDGMHAVQQSASDQECVFVVCISQNKNKKCD